MRDLSTNLHVARVQDGDDVHVIQYRRPTNEEMVTYQASLFVRKGNKLVSRVAEMRLKFGARILVGFEKGTFGYEGKPFSCDPLDPDYRENWKDLILQSAWDVVSAIGKHAFEGTTVVGETPEFGLEDELKDLFDEESDPTQAR